MKFSLPESLRYAAFVLIAVSSCAILGHGAIELASSLPVSVPSPQAAPSEDNLPAPPKDSSPLLVIDPGHGGEDGGASSAGVVEKDVNLAISLRVGDLCTIFGFPALLTRTEDVLLYDAYDDLEDYRGKQKTYDLRNRLRMAEESGAKVFLSVHQNQFPDTRYSGMQVYYSPNHPKSRTLAERIRVSGRMLLDPFNTREIKAATSAIYLLHRIWIPAVLAECGFLSSAGERELLVTPSYQQRVAASLFLPTAELLAEEDK